MSEPVNKLYCLFCKKEVLESETLKSENQLLCSTCGYVLSEEILYLDTTESPLNNIMPISNADWKEEIRSNVSYDIGLCTSIDPYCKDHSGKSFLTKSNISLKKTALRAKSASSAERNNFKAYVEAIRLGKALDLPQNIIKKVIDTYSEYSKKGVLKNRNVNSCIVCLLVIFCNANDVPLPVSEALKETTVSRKKFNKDYFNLYYLFEKAVPTGAKVAAYLQKLESHVENKWSKFSKFQQILKKVKEEGIFDYLEGRDAIVTTGAITYMILKHLKYPYLELYAKKLVLNRLTIKNKWAVLLDRWPLLKNYCNFISK